MNIYGSPCGSMALVASLISVRVGIAVTLVNEVSGEVVGFGLIEFLLKDPDVTEGF